MIMRIGIIHLKLEIPKSKNIDEKVPNHADLEFVRIIQVNNPTKINLLIFFDKKSFL